MIDPLRLRTVCDVPAGTGPVLYWMQRDQRVQDNWAFAYAQAQASARGCPLIVLFVLTPGVGEATARHYDFLLRGLTEVVDECADLNITFLFRVGDPATLVPACLRTHSVGEVVTDHNPLRHVVDYKRAALASDMVRWTEVDAHNIVPCWVASDKVEFAAHTFRPKVKREFARYNVPIPTVTRHPHTLSTDSADPIDVAQYRTAPYCDPTVGPVAVYTPGTRAGQAVLASFMSERLPYYSTRRNDPNAAALSDLSPYFHFGQISAQRAVADVMGAAAPRADKDTFFEEAVVRRELSDNFCYYNPHYDTLLGAHPWAQQTLAAHRQDHREYIYTQEQFASAHTHDPLWNAAQRQLLREGKMHGYMRMYWAKKILEWTASPEEAITIALSLNDRYELDGTDPNGVVGVLWSIAGVHDRAWAERPVFGKIRYMNDKGCARKFDVPAYIAKYCDDSPA